MTTGFSCETAVSLFVLEEEMNIYLEIFGYSGTLLIIISMMMSSVTKLRVINICGSVISGVYAALSGAYPIVLLNVALVAVNVFKLCRKEKKTPEGEIIKSKVSKDEVI